MAEPWTAATNVFGNEINALRKLLFGIKFIVKANGEVQDQVTVLCYLQGEAKVQFHFRSAGSQLW